MVLVTLILNSPQALFYTEKCETCWGSVLVSKAEKGNNLYIFHADNVLFDGSSSHVSVNVDKMNSHVVCLNEDVKPICCI